MAQEELKMTIGAEIDSDSLLKQLADVFRQATTILEGGISNISPKQQGSSGGDEEKGSASTGSFLKKMFGSMKSIMKTVGKIGLVASLVGAFMDTIKVVFKILESGIKIIVEMLRPIGDVVMMLLMPVLAMLKPILALTRTMMAPFKMAAMKGIAASNKLIGTGMKEVLAGNTEVGGTLLEEGWKGALSSASLMFSGFVEMIGSPIAELFGMGDKWAGIMDKWQDSALRGVATVMKSSEFVEGLGENISNIDNSILDTTFSMIKNGIDDIANSIEGGLKIENFEADMTTINSSLDPMLDSLITDIDELSTPINELKTSTDLTTDSLKALKLGIEDLSDVNLRNVVDFGGLDKALDSEGSKTGGFMKFIKQTGAAIGDLFGGDSSWSKKGKEIESANAEIEKKQLAQLRNFQGVMTEEEYQHYLDRYNLAKLSMAQENAAKIAGYNEMYGMTNLYMGHSIIPDNFKLGLTSMSASTSNFVNGLKTYSNAVSSVTKSIESAAKRAASAADSAERSASKARESSKKNDTRR